MCIELVPSGESHGFCGMGGWSSGCAVAGAPTNLGTSRSVGSDGIGRPLIAGIGGSVTSGVGVSEDAGTARTEAVSRPAAAPANTAMGRRMR